MKTVKTTMIVLFMCIAFLAACSQQNEPTGTAAAPEEKASDVIQEKAEGAVDTIQEKAEEAVDTIKERAEEAVSKPENQLQEISGTVMRTDDGFALFADTAQYKIVGQDLTDMVGENVKIVGTIEEQEGTQVITISSVSPIE